MSLSDFKLFNKLLEKYDLGLKFQVVGINFVRELLRLEKLFNCCWKYQLPANDFSSKPRFNERLVRR